MITRLIRVKDPDEAYQVEIEPVMAIVGYEMTEIDYKVRISRLVPGQPRSFIEEIDMSSLLRGYIEYARERS